MGYKRALKALIQKLSLGKVYFDTSMPGKMLLSFDDTLGCDPEQLVKTLHRHNVKATFFLTGSYIENNMDVVKMAAEHGHCIANHTYGHDRCTGLSLWTQFKSLKRTQKLIEEVVGDSSRVFRPPYGDISLPFTMLCLLCGYRIVMWSLGGNEFGSGTGSAEDVIRNITSALSPAGNDILLLHPESEKSHRAALDIVENGLIGGSRFISIKELLDSVG